MRDWFRGRSDEDFRDELDAHLAEETERQMRQRGLDERSARLAARRTFGNVLGAIERFHEARPWARTERVRQHLRYAVRALVLRPAFSITAVVSLGIGIGFMTAILTVFYALSMRALPVREAGSLVNVYQILHGKFGRGVHGTGSMVSYLEYESYRAAIDSAKAHGQSAIASAAVYASTDLAAETRGGTVQGEYVSCNYFGVLEVRLAMGRGFTPDECRHLGDPAVTVISHAMWTNDFGADPQIIGRVIRLNRVPLTVVGVAEQGFGGLSLLATGAWIPVTLEPVIDHGQDSIVVRDWSWMIMAARLAPGATISQARAQLAVAAAQRDAHLYPGRQTQVIVSRAALLNFPEAKRQGAVPAILVLLLAAVLVAMVSANIMNLLLARGLARRREIGIRLALGASRARLIEQLLAESLLIAILGGVVGYALAYLLPSLLPIAVPISGLQVNLAPDLRILFVTLGVSAVTALLFGLVPALHATDLDLVSAFKGAMTLGAQQMKSSRLRGTIVGVQVAGSALLLIVSALFVRAAQHAANVDPGYNMKDVVSFRFNLPQLGYTSARAGAFLESLRQRAAAAPDVDGAALVWPLPLLGRRQEPVQPIGSRTREIPGVSMASVTPASFEVLRIPLVEGRAYTDADVAADGDIRPAVVSQSLAKELRPDGGGVLGSTFKVAERTYVVTGVAADTRYTSLADERLPFVYMPPTRESAEELSLLVRTRGSPAKLERALPRWVHEMDPSVVVQTQRLAERADLALQPVRIAAMIAGAAGALAMFLALVGIYGVVGYAVSQQTRDFAIRQALGASRGEVVQLVLRQGARPVLIALVVATGLGLAIAQVIRRLLFGVSPLDPLSYLAVLFVMLLVSAAAMLAPARRATRISPATALRED